MAKTNAERQRAYRERRAGGEHPGPRCPGCRERDSTMARMAETASAVTRAMERHSAEVARLTDELEEAREQAAGRSAPPCKACGGQLACPGCSRGDDYA